jgi:predicted small secreted protein
MKAFTRTIVAILALAAGIVAFSGCHTIQGAGQDLEEAGEAMDDAVH